MVFFGVFLLVPPFIRNMKKKTRKCQYSGCRNENVHSFRYCEDHLDERLLLVEVILELRQLNLQVFNNSNQYSGTDRPTRSSSIQ